MIVFNPVKVFEQIQTCAKIYPIIQGSNIHKNISISTSLQDTYKDLNRINGTTGYTLLLYLVKNRVSLKIDNDKYFKDICELLIKFFVRHTFTDTPPSNTLDNIFITFIDEIENKNYTGDLICENLKRILKKAYNDDNDEIFKSRLRGDVYANDAIRFVLVKLAESYHQKEALTLWNKEHNKNKNEFYTWTIEHILPQKIKSKKKDSLGEDWIKMLADGDEAKALEIQADNVNKLGNLTLTAANSELSNKPFEDKKTMESDGYSKSILAGSLNAYVCNQTVWGAKQIQERTELLIEKILDLEIFNWEKKTKK